MLSEVFHFASNLDGSGPTLEVISLRSFLAGDQLSEVDTLQARTSFLKSHALPRRFLAAFPDSQAEAPHSFLLGCSSGLS
jgi:hypothetical protein